MLKKGLGSERRVRLVRNGRNQVVRIPREFELPAQEAIMRKQGHRLIIEPAPAKSLRAVFGRSSAAYGRRSCVSSIVLPIR